MSCGAASSSRCVFVRSCVFCGGEDKLELGSHSWWGHVSLQTLWETKNCISLFVCTVCLYLILVCTLLEKVLNKNNTVIRQSVVKHSEFFKFFLWCEMLTDVLKIKSQFQIIISSMIWTVIMRGFSSKASWSHLLYYKYKIYKTLLLLLLPLPQLLYKHNSNN